MCSDGACIISLGVYSSEEREIWVQFYVFPTGPAASPQSLRCPFVTDQISTKFRPTLWWACQVSLLSALCPP